MAVSKMQLVNIVGPIDGFYNTAQTVIETGCFHPDNIRNVLKGFSRLLPFEDTNPYKGLIKKANELSNLVGKDSICDGHKIDDSVEDMTLKIESFHARLETNAALIESKKQSIAESCQVITQIDMLTDTDCDISDFFKLEYIKFRFGRISKSVYNNIRYLEDEKLFIFIPTSIEQQNVWGMYFAARANIEYVDSMFASMQFERIKLSSKIHGNPSQAKQYLENEISSENAELEKAVSDRKTMLNEAGEYIGNVLTTINVLNECEDLKKLCGQTGSKFYMAGWVPTEKIKIFDEKISIVSGLKITREKINDKSHGAPTKLKNPLIVRPFEMFVKMYGMPKYGEFDPTLLVAITYSLFFGIMFGDLGQGLCVSIVGFLMYKFKKMELGKILIPIGISSAVFGVVYDSVFGYEGVISRVVYGEERELFFTPSNHMMPALGITLALGVVFIAVVMILNIINSLKNKDIESAIFGPNGVFGLIFYCALIAGLSGIILAMFSDISYNLFSTAYIVFLLIVPGIIIFFREPLAKLVTGRKDWFPKKFGEYLMSNIFELFEICLSYCTNSLSFVRVGAFALSHASMMSVVFSLAGIAATAPFGSGNLLVIVIGNVFVMCLEGLIVGIQVLRLEFYELFSRFYSGEGIAYEPIKISK